MLCGSVGDGKSHLLAYLKTNYPEFFENGKFNVHNDATESFDPTKNEIDTLAEVLSSFNDDNIDRSYEKLILAINLGVLNNFLESNYIGDNYSKLKEIIDDANIFNSKIVSKNVIQDKVSFITFSDYNLFELNGDSDSNYISSEYVSSLFSKISAEDMSNPFYVAYLKDKKENYISPLIYNYEMFRDESVQKVIIDYMIKIFVEYKKIISTRDLLNFIYELLVPPEIIDYGEFANVGDFVDHLLPNVLFDSPERSDILNLFNKFDPTLVRTEGMDKFIIEFNVNESLNEILTKYFDTSKIEFLKSYFVEFEDLPDSKPHERNYLVTLLIRLGLFYGKKDFKINFVDQDYLNFLNYLHGYNVQNHGQYKELFAEIKDAIFKWKGSFKKDYLCIDELESFRVSKLMKLKFKPDKWDESLLNGLYLGNRFKTEIKVYFSVSSSEERIPLDIDFPLYKSIVKLNEGFKPNKAEKENLILFDEFINELIVNSDSNDLFIKSLDSDIEFSFEFDESFETFSFGRG